jgi:hypothetical protein
MLREPSSPAELAVAFLATWRLGEKLKKAAMTENAVAKEIVDAAFRVHITRGISGLRDLRTAALGGV